MTDHVHDWQPLQGQFNRYTCACGSSGYRTRSGEFKGQIVAHKDAKTQTKYTTPPTETTARPTGGPSSNAPGGRRLGSGHWK